MTSIALPDLIWHDILDAILAASEKAYDCCYSCPRCEELDEDFCSPAHVDAFDYGQQLVRTEEFLRRLLASHSPARFAQAVIA